MAYYVRPNSHPRDRAELRIVIKVRGDVSRPYRLPGYPMTFGFGFVFISVT